MKVGTDWYSLFEMVDEILFCMVQFIFYKTYRAIELGRI